MVEKDGLDGTSARAEAKASFFDKPAISVIVMKENLLDSWNA